MHMKDLVWLENVSFDCDKVLLSGIDRSSETENEANKSVCTTVPPVRAVPLHKAVAASLTSPAYMHLNDRRNFQVRA